MSRQVEDDLDPLDTFPNHLLVGHIAGNQVSLGVHVLQVAGGDVIEHTHGVALVDEGVGDAGPDEPSPASDQDRTRRAPLIWWL